MTTGDSEGVTQRKHANGNGHSNGNGQSAKGALKGLKRAPTAVPPFSVGDIRKAIPEHCFQRSYVTSFRYLFVDLAVVAALFYCSSFIDATLTDARFGATAGWALRVVAWTAYWWIQGNVMTGLWVIGHECGHGGFSDSELCNDVVGIVVHSLLLVPYFSWKISHRRHHSNTGNIDRDEVFVPEVAPHPGAAPPTAEARNAAVDEDGEVGQWMLFTARSLYRTAYLAVRIVLMLTLGWPLYLAMNATGHKTYPAGVSVNHFSPSSPIFTSEKERRQVLLSDVALGVVFALFAYVSYTYGFVWFVKTYGIPYLITNAFLVLITFLQHTDPALPHYSGDEWDWLRGALATIDRDYGYLNVLHHHIADTHVVHHLFSFMPHYHAEEATRAVIPLLKEYYRCDKTPIPQALWQSFARCTFVSADNDETAVNAHPNSAEKGVYWFQRGQYT